MVRNQVDTIYNVYKGYQVFISCLHFTIIKKLYKFLKKYCFSFQNKYNWMIWMKQSLHKDHFIIKQIIIRKLKPFLNYKLQRHSFGMKDVKEDSLEWNDVYLYQN